MNMNMNVNVNVNVKVCPPVTIGENKPPTTHALPPMMVCHPINNDDDNNDKKNNNINKTTNRYTNAPASGPLLSSVLSPSPVDASASLAAASSSLRGIDSDRTIRAASRKSRVYYMYRFLVSTYPSIFIPFTDDDNDNDNDNDNSSSLRNRANSTGDGENDEDDDDVIILDVAGGKGDLSWFINNLHPAISSNSQLRSKSPNKNDNPPPPPSINNHKQTTTTTKSRRNGIHSVVMDPRPTNHQRLIKSAHFLETMHPTMVQQRNVPGSPTFQPLAALLPDLIRCRDYYRMTTTTTTTSLPLAMDTDSTGNCDDEDDVGTKGRRWKEAGSLRNHVDAELVRHVQRCTTTTTPTTHTPHDEDNEEEEEGEDCAKKDNPMIDHSTASHNTELKSPPIIDDDIDDIDPEAFKEWNVYWTRACDRAEQLHPSSKPKSPPFPSSQTTTTISTTTTTKAKAGAKKALSTITNAKLIVGFHPDQATEAIIDLAIHLGIPYCIVPCCVFPSEFPHRTVRVVSSTISSLSSEKEKEKKEEEGAIRVQQQQQQQQQRDDVVIDAEETTTTKKEEDKDDDDVPVVVEEVKKVRDYTLFLEYLRCKHPNVQRIGNLNFPYSTQTAKSVVLYTLPQDMI